MQRVATWWRCWDLESIGIIDSPKISREEEAIKKFNETTQYIDKRYIVGWPWNEYPPSIPSNFGLAFGRLVNQIKRLDSKTLSLYDQTLKEQIAKSVIEVVPEPADDSVNNPVHYLPHHGVQQPGKLIRIVYDASAKTKNNKSLNECLYCGPIMLEDLTGLLLRFRSYPIGISSDVEKAFLQIGLQQRDRDVTRFLWLKDVTKPPTESNLMHLRFCRVPFGIISSPFLLNATIKHHLLKSGDERTKKVAKDIYVDNLITGTNTISEAKEIYNSAKEAFTEISMNLREWSSNSKEFMEYVPDACKDSIVKILGLNWRLENDSIQLRFKDNNATATTKRGILKIVASVYDPCGYAVPSLLPAKLILQELWKKKVKWDSPLSKEINDEWVDVRNKINDIQDISLPRYYIRDAQGKDCILHCFTDSSSKAYAAVVYVVSGNKRSFVIGKSRLVPIKDQENMTIPRLELLGVLIGCRLMKYVLKFLELNVKQQILWTDSKIVIDWYNSNKLLPPFVAKRIEEIKENKALAIRYVPSQLNSVDVATRPTSSKEDKERWLTGPSFLVEGPSSWPSNTTKESSLLAGEGLSNIDDVLENRNNNHEPETTHKENDLNNGYDKNEGLEKDNDETNNIQEIKNIQTEYFPDEVAGKETNLSRNLSLFKDVDGIMRCKGRLKHAYWSFDKRYPVLLPKDCHLTNKIIMKLHEDNYHVGVNHTLSIIRQYYWIPQGKSHVQKILKKCQRCVKHGGGPFKLPPTPALPPERVNYTAPFTFTGVDYLGPVLVNTGNGTSKRWICLFTCLAVRAIHLEVVGDLTAEEGLLALRRMISGRGEPTLITSDNALHFKLLSEILVNTYCIQNKIRWRFIPQLAPWFGGFYERLVGMVKECMKRTLQKHLLNDNQLLTIVKEIEAVLNTRPLTCVDTELEHVLKPSDFLTMGKCITTEASPEDPILLGSTTKSDLVKGWRKALIILDEFKEMFSNRYLPSLRERYWHSHKEPRVTSKFSPCEGQIVQMKGDSKNRESWKVGKIVSLVKGTDGMCRIAKVKIGNSEFTRSISQLYPLEVEESKYKDAITIPECEPINEDSSQECTELIKSIDLEKETEKHVSTDDSHEEVISDIIRKESDVAESTDKCETEDVQCKSSELSKDSRPKRGAALRALEKIKEWTHNLISLL